MTVAERSSPPLPLETNCASCTSPSPPAALQASADDFERMLEEEQRLRAGLERDLQVGSCCCCCHVIAAVCVPSMHFLAECFN